MKGYTISLLSAFVALAVASTTVRVPSTPEYAPISTSGYYAPSESPEHPSTEPPYPDPITPTDGGNFTAVVGPKGGVELRLPVHRLQADHPDVFNMFILALQAIQNLPESYTLRYGACGSRDSIEYRTLTDRPKIQLLPACRNPWSAMGRLGVPDSLHR